MAEPIVINTPDVSNLDIALEVRLNGAYGVWLPSDMAKDIQADVESYKAQNKQMLLLEKQLDVKDQRLQLLQDSLKLQEEVSSTYKSGFEVAVKAQREAEEDKFSIFSGQPGIWVLVGAVVAGVLIAVGRRY